MEKTNKRQPNRGNFQKGHKINVGNKYRQNIAPWNKGLNKEIAPTMKGGRPYGSKDSKKRSTVNYRYSAERKEKMRQRNIKLGIKPPVNIGEKCWNWMGGISKNPYPKEFNKALKLRIRTRDNFICCKCGRTEREELEELNRALSVNHIDFNKNNCNEKNLNTLCLRCNVEINRDRDYWTNYFNK